MVLYQVAKLGGDPLIVFWDQDSDGHQSRFLVRGDGRTWMDTKRAQAIRSSAHDKHTEPLARVMAARAD